MSICENIRRVAEKKEKYIIRIEDFLGITFPEQYKSELQVGDYEKALLCSEEDKWKPYPFFDQMDKKDASLANNIIMRKTQAALKHEGFPENGIPVAENESGDKLFFKKGSDGKLGDPVYRWNMESKQVSVLVDNFWDLVIEMEF